MCNRSQMGTTGTSDAEQTDNSKALGFDGFNQRITGNQSMTITGQRVDSKNIPTVFTLKIRGGREVDSKGNRAGKGALIQTNLSATPGVSQDQTLFVQKKQIICVATQQGGAEIMYDKCPTITAAAGMSGNNQPIICKSNRGGCYSIDEKMGNTYVWEDQANTLASRDYKQPQAVVVRKGNEKDVGKKHELPKQT